MAASKSKRKVLDDTDVNVEVTGSDSIELDDILDDDEAVDIEIEVSAPVAEALTPKTKSVSTGSIADLIADLDEDKPWLTYAFYGKNGTGKTHLGATCDGSLILPIEDGTITIRKMGNKGKIKKLPIINWQSIEDAYWMLHSGTPTAEGIVIKTKTGNFLVRAVVFDTLTRLVQVCLRSVVLGAAATDPSKDVVSPTLRDWGIMSQKIQYWLMQFEELPVHKVWLLQETSMGETDDEEFAIFPDMNRALRNFVQSEADVIGRTCIVKYEGQSVHALKFGANTRFITKDRTGDLGKTWINPRLDKIIAKSVGA